MPKRYPRILHVYVPDHEARTIQNFKEICKREGSSASEKILEWARDYVDKHKNGNPQLLLRSFTRGPKVTKLLPPCGHIGNKTVNKVYCNLYTIWHSFLNCWKCWNRKKGRIK